MAGDSVFHVVIGLRAYDRYSWLGQISFQFLADGVGKDVTPETGNGYSGSVSAVGKKAS